MPHYELTWHSRSALATRLQSDTIFGHLAWALRYAYGDTRLCQFLEALREAPVLTLSSAMPRGYLPIPHLPVDNSVRLRWLDANAAKHRDAERVWTQLEKAYKRLGFAPADLIATPEGCFDPLRIIELLGNESSKAKRKAKAPSYVLHNSINRITATTDEDSSLYAERLISYPPKVGSDKAADPALVSYIQCEESVLNYNELRMACDFIVHSGFGKNKSAGRGRMDIQVEPYSPRAIPNANAHLLLSNFVPASSDTTRCSAKGIAKFPRTGGSYSLGKSPFKYPIYMFEPGSVYWGDTPPRGSLLSGVHPDMGEIVQNLYAYSIPICLQEV